MNNKDLSAQKQLRLFIPPQRNFQLLVDWRKFERTSLWVSKDYTAPQTKSVHWESESPLLFLHSLRFERQRRRVGPCKWRRQHTLTRLSFFFLQLHVLFLLLVVLFLAPLLLFLLAAGFIEMGVDEHFSEAAFVDDAAAHPLPMETRSFTRTLKGINIYIQNNY